MLDSKVVLYAEECRFGFIFSKLAAPCCIYVWQNPYTARNRRNSQFVFKAVHEKHLYQNLQLKTISGKDAQQRFKIQYLEGKELDKELGISRNCRVKSSCGMNIVTKALGHLLIIF
jgi:hypothetical protein